MEKKDMNPANAAGKTDAERKRIPMSVPVQRLEAPEIPGYHLHWFNGMAERIARAQAGGYEFVYDKDIKINAVGLGGTSTISGNTDMGSQVSVVSGESVDKDGQPSRMVLMKIKQEWYEADQQLVTDRNENVASALRGGKLGVEKDGPGDTAARYVGSTSKIPDLFNPHKRPKVAA